MTKQFEQAYDNFLAGCDVDTTMLDCAEFMFNAGRESVGKQAELVAFNGWYCAQCQRGVAPSEVTYHETHTECGRYITDDEPPAQPVQPDFSDAYQGAREDAEIWKKRALEAEELNRKFIADINGETFMGEPVQPVHPAKLKGDDNE